MPAPGPDKELCGAIVKNGERAGERCRRVAGAGTNHKGFGKCSKHGGNTPSHRANGEQLAIEATVRKLGIPKVTTAAQALLDEIHETAGNIEFYRELIQDLDTHPEPDDYEIVEGRKGKDVVRNVPGEAGIYGKTYHVSGAATGEAKPHILVQMYNDERKHLATITVAALRVGIAEKMVQLAAQEAETIADVCRSFAIALGHDPHSEEVREAFRAQLTRFSEQRRAA